MLNFIGRLLTVVIAFCIIAALIPDWVWVVMAVVVVVSLIRWIVGPTARRHRHHHEHYHYHDHDRSWP